MVVSAAKGSNRGSGPASPRNQRQSTTETVSKPPRSPRGGASTQQQQHHQSSSRTPVQKTKQDSTTTLSQQHRSSNNAGSRGRLQPASDKQSKEDQSSGGVKEEDDRDRVSSSTNVASEQEFKPALSSAADSDGLYQATDSGVNVESETTHDGEPPTSGEASLHHRSGDAAVEEEEPMMDDNNSGENGPTSSGEQTASYYQKYASSSTGVGDDSRDDFVENKSGAGNLNDEDGTSSMADYPRYEEDEDLAPGAGVTEDGLSDNLRGTQDGEMDEGQNATSSAALEAVSIEELLIGEEQKAGDFIASVKLIRDKQAEDLIPKNRGWGSHKTRIRIGDEEAAFILGKGGRTKAKISRVSGAKVSLTDSLILELTGSETARRRAELYIKLVILQRKGPVVIDFDEKDCNDLTCVDVPTTCVAFVTGQQGRVLRSIEEEWGTLMFFVRHKDNLTEEMRRELMSEAVRQDRRRFASPGCEKLIIFGDVRGRRGAELKVISAIEQKERGRFSNVTDVEPYISEELGFDTDIVAIAEEDFSYALGKDGCTRRKLAKASNCVLEYVGHMAYIAGVKEERERCREYLGWLIKQRIGNVHVETSERTDVSVLVIPSELIRVVAGPRGVALRKLEGTSNTFCFIDSDPYDDKHQRLLIFSHSGKARRQAQEYITAQLDRYIDQRRFNRERENVQFYNHPGVCGGGISGGGGPATMNGYYGSNGNNGNRFKGGGEGYRSSYGGSQSNNMSYQKIVTSPPGFERNAGGRMRYGGAPYGGGPPPSTYGSNSMYRGNCGPRYSSEMYGRPDWAGGSGGTDSGDHYMMDQQHQASVGQQPSSLTYGGGGGGMMSGNSHSSSCSPINQSSSNNNMLQYQQQQQAPPYYGGGGGGGGGRGRGERGSRYRSDQQRYSGPPHASNKVGGVGDFNADNMR